MHFLTTTALAALAASLVSAQTHTDCQPLKETCPNNPAIAASFSSDFTTGEDSLKGWTVSGIEKVDFNSKGADLTIKKSGDFPTITTNGYFQFGHVEVKLKVSTGQGIISSIVLESQDLDEIDFEWTSKDTAIAETNYFGKGITGNFDRGANFPVSSPQTEYHTYAIDWTAEKLDWIIDGKVVRSLKYADAEDNGNHYPQTPMQLKIGSWAGGDQTKDADGNPKNAPGVVEWAGGPTDFSKGPFVMSVESVKIINNTPAKEYQYTDKTGSYKSIKAIGAGDNAGGAETSAIVEPVSSGVSQIVAPPASATGAVSSAASSADASTGSPAESTMITHSEGCTKSATVTGIPASAATTLSPASGPLPVTQISDGQIQVPPAPSTSIPDSSAEIPYPTSTPSSETSLAAIGSTVYETATTTKCDCGVHTIYITSGTGSTAVTLTSLSTSTVAATAIPVYTGPASYEIFSSITPIDISTAVPVSSGGLPPVTQISDGQIQAPPAPSTLVTETSVAATGVPIPVTSTGLPSAIPYPTGGVSSVPSQLVTETRSSPAVSGGLLPSSTSSGLITFTGAANPANKAAGWVAAAMGVAAIVVL